MPFYAIFDSNVVLPFCVPTYGTQSAPPSEASRSAVQLAIPRANSFKPFPVCQPKQQQSFHYDQGRNKPSRKQLQSYDVCFNCFFNWPLEVKLPQRKDHSKAMISIKVIVFFMWCWKELFLKDYNINYSLKRHCNKWKDIWKHFESHIIWLWNTFLFHFSFEIINQQINDPSVFKITAVIY